MPDVLFVILNVTILTSLFSCVKSFSQCITPHGLQGECVNLNSCESLKQIIRKKPLTYQNRVFLRQSQCDYFNGVPWVCCPTERKPQTTTRKPRTSTTGNSIDEGSFLLKAGESICGKPFRRIEDRIYGGEETMLGEFPWMAVLMYEKPNKRSAFGCGGSLITNRHVLTAAHCVLQELIPKTWFLKKVRLGEWDRATNPDCQEIDSVYYCATNYVENNIVSIYSHEFYQKTDLNKLNDIALLKLESFVDFTDYVRPICIDLTSSVSTFYGTVTAIGFGKTELMNTSQRMLKAEVDIVNHRECKRKYRSQGRQIADSQICALKHQTDTCNGDSGAGLMKQSDTYPSYWYLVGVTSFGPARCGSSDYPGIYTKIEPFISWIQSKIKL